ncbi:hypothetical protein SI855_002633 [Clostridioides difficile]|nr:hypothetical protein [Clostridioides difficile]
MGIELILSKIKNRLNNNNGSIAIVGCALILVFVTVATGFLSLSNSSWVLNEVQSIMDLSTTNALQQSINNEYLRQEVINVSNSDSSISNDGVLNVDNKLLSDVISTSFRKELNRQVGLTPFIQKIDINYLKPEFVYENWGLNYAGDSNKERPQLILDSIVQITLKNYREFDNLGSYIINEYNARDNGNMKISVEGKTGDGNLILTIRTLSRLVYR